MRVDLAERLAMHRDSLLNIRDTPIVLKKQSERNPKIVQRIGAIRMGMWTKAESLTIYRNGLLDMRDTLIVLKEQSKRMSKVVQINGAMWVGMWTKAESLAMHQNGFFDVEQFEQYTLKDELVLRHINMQKPERR